MENPPQQEPPIYAPSEIYTPEQPQVYSSQTQIYTQQYPSAIQGQEIVIYPNRTQAIVRTIFCVVLLIFGIMLLTGTVALIFILAATF